MAIVKTGDWQRPCTTCGRSPADGAVFTPARTAEGKAARRSACADCCNAKAKEHREQGRCSDSWEPGGDWSRPCKRCGRSGNDVDFDVGARRYGKLYRKSYCRPCAVDHSVDYDRRNPAKAMRREAKRDRDYPKERQERKARDSSELRRATKRANVRNNYGISLEDYEFRFELQGGACTICEDGITLDRGNKELRTAHLDHDHETGKIRDFLCDRCNVMLGMARERTDIFLAAIDYLEVRHRGGSG